MLLDLLDRSSNILTLLNLISICLFFGLALCDCLNFIFSSSDKHFISSLVNSKSSIWFSECSENMFASLYYSILVAVEISVLISPRMLIVVMLYFFPQ